LSHPTAFSMKKGWGESGWALRDMLGLSSLSTKGKPSAADPTFQKGENIIGLWAVQGVNVESRKKKGKIQTGDNLQKSRSIWHNPFAVRLAELQRSGRRRVRQ